MMKEIFAVIPLFASCTFVGAFLAHVEAPVTDLLGGIEEQGRVGLLAF